MSFKPNSRSDDLSHSIHERRSKEKKHDSLYQARQAQVINKPQERTNTFVNANCKSQQEKLQVGNADEEEDFQLQAKGFGAGDIDDYDQMLRAVEKEQEAAMEL